MKHIKIAFVLLAAIFVTLSSFNSTGKGKVGEVKTFEFIGERGLEESDAAYWIVASPEMTCDGGQNLVCRITLASDDIDGQHPDPSVLSALLAEAATGNPEVFLAGQQGVDYINGTVTVFAE